MKKQLKRAKGIITRLTALALAVATILSMGAAITPPAVSAASFSWPQFSETSYLEMVLFGSSGTLPVYMDPELKTRGTCQPQAKYDSYLDAGDALKIYSITEISTKVAFPTKNGTKVGFVSTKSLFGVSSPVGTFTSKASVNVMSINKSITNYGSTEAGDTIIPCATAKNGYTLILYTAVKKSSGRIMKAGFVSGEDLNKLQNGTSFAQAPTESDSVKVTLNVPSYKQTDSRWSGTKIGSKTIGNVGCLITDLAMVESYNTGTTIFPDVMKAKLKFDNNDLIWSSAKGYTHLTYNTGITNAIMAKIYAQLKAGRPVIIGACNSKGSHWVVVTGYTGNSTSSFDPSNFKINDPNANRTTLAHFLTSYPTVRGLVY